MELPVVLDLPALNPANKEAPRFDITALSTRTLPTLYCVVAFTTLADNVVLAFTAFADKIPLTAPLPLMLKVAD